MNEEKRNFYLKQLNHQDPNVRRDAILNLGEEREPFLFKILSTHFTDGHPLVREALYGIFTRNRERWAAEIAADTLYSSQLSARSLAMRILRHLGSAAVIPIKRLTRAVDPEVRKIAAELLGDIQDAHSSEILMNMLDEKNEEVLLVIIEALGKQREIRAVPHLLTLHEQYPKLKPVILNSLASIFVYWERNITNSPMDEADPVLLLSFLLSVQDTGLPSAYSHVIRCLHSDRPELAVEALKALAAILSFNPQIQLSVDLLPVLLRIKETDPEDFLENAVLTALSRIPSFEALSYLMERYMGSGGRTETREALTEFLKRYSSIFLGYYREIPEFYRLEVLKLCVQAGIGVSERKLFALYRESAGEEQALLLSLILENQLLDTKAFILSEIDSMSGESRYRALGKLLACRDEILWPFYLKLLETGDSTEKELAFRGLLQYPAKTKHYISRRLNIGDLAQASRWLDLAFSLSLPDVSDILRDLISRFDKRMLKLLREHLTFTTDVSDWLVILSILKDKPVQLEFVVKGLTPPASLNEPGKEELAFWNQLSVSDKKELEGLLDALGLSVLKQHLRDANKKFHQTSRQADRLSRNVSVRI